MADTAITVVSISSNISLTSNAILPALLPNDVCDNCLLFLQGSDPEDPGVPKIVGVEIYVHSTQPGSTSATVRGGRKLMDINIPVDIKPLNSLYLGLISLKVSLPMYHRANQRERFLAVIITTDSANGISGSCVFKVFRPLPKG